MNEEYIVLESMNSAYDFIAEEGKFGDAFANVAGTVLSAPIKGAVWLYENNPKARAERKEKENREAKSREQVANMPKVSFEEFKSEYYPKYKACIKELRTVFNSLHGSNKISNHSRFLKWSSTNKFEDVDNTGRYPEPPAVVIMDYIYPKNFDDEDLRNIITKGDNCPLIDKMIKIAHKYGMQMDYHYDDGIPYEWYIRYKDNSHNFSSIENSKLKSLKL